MQGQVGKSGDHGVCASRVSRRDITDSRRPRGRAGGAGAVDWTKEWPPDGSGVEALAQADTGQLDKSIGHVGDREHDSESQQEARDEPEVNSEQAN